MKMRRKPTLNPLAIYFPLLSGLLLASLFFSPFLAVAQEVHQDLQGVWKAKVLHVTDPKTIIVPGTSVESEVQSVEARILEGEREGEVVTFENDYILLERGDTFFMNYLVTIQGDEFYSVREKDRRGAMFVLFALFVAVVLLIGGMQGFKSLLALAGSIFVILYVLVPQLVSGASPVPLSVLVAGAVLFFAIFFTHGFNRRSAIAYAGTMIAVSITGFLAYFSIDLTGLTGFASDEAVYLNLNTGGELDFVGLLLAAIIVGALGVLDDIAVTQVAVVRELFGMRERITKWDVYKKAMRVGREHVGALINTLVLAYTGAALPLLLLFSLSETSMLTIVNREIFATEIVRALVGSIGLVLTVPITTLLAVLILDRFSDEELSEEESSHTHSH
ncbi:MAG: YibE/F family protein [Candidatus Paceibacterota bacterium]